MSPENIVISYGPGHDVHFLIVYSSCLWSVGGRRSTWRKVENMQTTQKDPGSPSTRAHKHEFYNIYLSVILLNTSDFTYLVGRLFDGVLCLKVRMSALAQNSLPSSVIQTQPSPLPQLKINSIMHPD